MDLIKNNGRASVPAIKQYLKSADACGVDYLPLLSAAGIDPKVIDDNTSHV